MDGVALAPSPLHGKPMKSGFHSWKRRNKCLVLTAAFVGAVVVVFGILGLTVFRPRRPVTTVNSVSLNDLHVSVDIRKPSVRLNLTLDAHLTVSNPNNVGFNYTNTSALLLYRGDVVGEAPIPAGAIIPDGTAAMNVTLTILADRLLSNAHVYSDVITGSLPLATSASISGEVSIFKLIKFHVDSYATCNLIIHAYKRSVEQSDCKTKL